MAVRSEIVDGRKRCGRCGEWKPVTEFHVNKRAATGLTSGCIPCTLERKRISRIKHHDPERQRGYRAKYKANNAESIRAADRRRRLKKKFGVTPEWYDEQLNKQLGACAICYQEETAIDRATGEIKMLAVDHDHETGEARGLLCSRCNVGLGQFKDDAVLLTRAIKYLEGSFK